MELEKKITKNQFKVASAAFLSLFSLVGIMFYGLPFFYDFWMEDFGWSRATITSGPAIGKIIIGPLFGFIAGWCIDKFGPRRLMLTGILMGGLALVGLSMMTSLWQLYLFYILNALGYLFGGPLPNQVMISRWFTKRRGKVMGLAYIGIGVGGMIVPQVAQSLNMHFGWRNGLMGLGILMVVVALPMAWFTKDNPDNSSDDSPEVAKTAAKNEPSHQSFKNIVKQWPFYLLLIGSFCSIGAVAGTAQNLKLFLSGDLNYTQQDAANILSIVLGASIVGRLLMGYLADRIQKKYVMVLVYALVAIAIPMLFFAEIKAVVYVFAFLFGVALGGDYMIIPLMAAELFGVKALGRVMGIIISADGLGEAFGPMLAAWLRDVTGSYANGFSSLIVLAVIGTIAIALLPKNKQELN